MVKAHTQNIHRSMEQDKKLRNKPTRYGEGMTQEAIIYNGEKTVSSISITGKSGQLHVKE